MPIWFPIRSRSSAASRANDKLLFTTLMEPWDEPFDPKKVRRDIEWISAQFSEQIDELQSSTDAASRCVAAFSGIRGMPVCFWQPAGLE